MRLFFREGFPQFVETPGGLAAFYHTEPGVDVTIISFVFNSLRKDVQHFAEWDKLTRNEEDFISF
ncbi:MAG: hypothetical protein CVV03_01430 [Firmicutes bacterium HGW-Firmicutes-8]|nr:MAG: hypothetical protein CVV03_01430 [Firmicutes bacterium HGW-Firmicutes-8]